MTDVLTGSNPSAMGPKTKGPHSWEPIKSVVGDEGCPRAASPPALALGLRPSRAALENASRFLSSALLRVRIPCTGPKKKGLHRWRPNNSMAGDEGCPRAAGAVRAPLRRSAPRVLRWKTLRVSSAPHPCGFESHAPGTKKKGLHHWRPNNSMVGDEGFEPPALCV